MPEHDASPASTLPAALRLGRVDLSVRDLDRSAGFYSEALGLVERGRDDALAVMGTESDDLVALHEDPSARPAGRHAGLFHLALLYPSRAELARALRRLAETRTAISGASDHGVSEAIYLSDPEGNGIELYADRPRDRWPPPSRPDERVGMYTIALDIEDLLRQADGGGAPRPPEPGLRMGHLHLHVGDLREGLAFYGDAVGFELMTEYPGALFVSAGGYHHHLGFNVWRGEGVGPQPATAVGLRRWTVVLEDERQLSAVRARLASAGIGTEEEPGTPDAAEDQAARSFGVLDPWDIPLAFVAA